MMKQWTLFPTVLQRKFLLTLLAGIASAGISVIICVATKDHILLALGIVVLCACLISCRWIWATAAHKNYEVVEGICAGISTPMLRHYRKVHLIDSHGIEITLLLSKSARLKIGAPYRFTFRKGRGLPWEMTIWTQPFQRTAFWAMKQSASRSNIPIRPLNPKNARWF